MNKQDQSTKERIIDKAFSLFSLNGIKDISMREIAAACGVTKPVIYYYFKDKDALCEEMASYMRALQKNKLQELIDAKLPFAKFLEKLFSGYQEGAGNKKTIGFMLHLYSYMSSRPALERKIQRIRKDEPQELLKLVVAAEVKAGRLPADMQNIAVHLMQANAVHIVLQTQQGRIRIPKTYPAESAQAVLRAVCYKGDKK